MKIDLITSISFKDPQIQEFLQKMPDQIMEIEPKDELGFTNVKKNRVYDLFTPFTQNYHYAINEKWRVSQLTLDVPPKKISKGINTIQVIKIVTVEINFGYWIYFSDNATQKAVKKGEDLLKKYKPNPSDTLQDFQKWVISNLDADLTEDSFVIKNSIVLRKVKEWEEASQRDAFLRFYDPSVTSTTDKIVLVDNEESIQMWTSERGVVIEHLLGQDEIINESTPAVSDHVVEETIPAGTDPASVDRPTTDKMALDVLDPFLKKIVPTNCGVMLPPRQFPVLDIAIIPEFKLAFKRVYFRIGCVDVSFDIPVLQMRLSRLVLYAYFSLPKNTGKTIVKIGETCAIRSALAASVIGLVTFSGEAAAAAFEAEFKNCLIDSIRECVFSGLTILKICPPWQDVA